MPDVYLPNQAKTLVATQATELVGTGTTGLDVAGRDEVSFVLTNNNGGGDNPITAVSVLWSNDPTGTRWTPARALSIPGGAIAKNASFDATLSTRGYLRLRIQATSTLGTTLVLDLHATDSDVVSPEAVNGAPVATAVTATVSGVAQDATLTGGTQKAIARGGAKGATTAADVTSTSLDADHQALDTKAAQGTPAAASGAWPTKDDFATQEILPDQSGANGVRTFTFSAAVQAYMVTSQGSGLSRWPKVMGRRDVLA
jgi:hypothetical protein